MVKSEMLSVLSVYQNKVEKIIRDHISLLGPKSSLRDACEYALTCGGKRFRPSLVLMVSEAVGKGADVDYAALATELFHTASLVADDMPSMDDDDERRNHPSVHKMFGEAAALLVTYALIAAGYDCLAKNAQISKGVCDVGRVAVLALENATYNTGLNGATGGQFLDIYPPDLTLTTLRDIIHKKTVSLFEISFVFGWLFGGGDVVRLEDVKKAASHFGMAFQIADDIGDMEQDIQNKRQVNMANIFGKDEAIKMFHVEQEGYRRIIHSLPIQPDELLTLTDGLL